MPCKRREAPSGGGSGSGKKAASFDPRNVTQMTVEVPQFGDGDKFCLALIPTKMPYGNKPSGRVCLSIYCPADKMTPAQERVLPFNKGNFKLPGCLAEFEDACGCELLGEKFEAPKPMYGGEQCFPVTIVTHTSWQNVYTAACTFFDTNEFEYEIVDENKFDGAKILQEKNAPEITLNLQDDWYTLSGPTFNMKHFLLMSSIQWNLMSPRAQWAGSPNKDPGAKWMVQKNGESAQAAKAQYDQLTADLEAGLDFIGFRLVNNVAVQSI